MTDLTKFIERLKLDGYPTAHVERQLERMKAMETIIVDQNKEIERLESQLESGVDGQSMLPTELLDGMHKRIERLEDEVRAWRSTVEALRFEAARFTDFLTICEDALNDSKEQT